MDFFQKEKMKLDIRTSIARQNKILQNDTLKTQIKKASAEKDLMEPLPRSINTLKNNDCLKTAPLKKTVRINSRVLVHLIPTRQEYFAAKLTNHLWWAPHDKTRCKEEAVEEIRNFQKAQTTAKKTVSAREAINALYQPARY